MVLGLCLSFSLSHSEEKGLKMMPLTSLHCEWPAWSLLPRSPILFHRLLKSPFKDWAWCWGWHKLNLLQAQGCWRKFCSLGGRYGSPQLRAGVSQTPVGTQCPLLNMWCENSPCPLPVVRQENQLSAELGFIFKSKQRGGEERRGGRAFQWLGKELTGSVWLCVLQVSCISEISPTEEQMLKQRSRVAAGEGRVFFMLVQTFSVEYLAVGG